MIDTFILLQYPWLPLKNSPSSKSGTAAVQSTLIKRKHNTTYLTVVPHYRYPEKHYPLQWQTPLSRMLPFKDTIKTDHILIELLGAEISLSSSRHNFQVIIACTWS